MTNWRLPTTQREMIVSSKAFDMGHKAKCDPCKQRERWVCVAQSAFEYPVLRYKDYWDEHKNVTSANNKTIAR